MLCRERRLLAEYLFTNTGWPTSHTCGFGLSQTLNGCFASTRYSHATRCRIHVTMPSSEDYRMPDCQRLCLAPRPRKGKPDKWMSFGVMLDAAAPFAQDVPSDGDGIAIDER